MQTFYVLFHYPTGLYESIDTYFGKWYNHINHICPTELNGMNITLLAFKSYNDANVVLDILSADSILSKEVYEIEEKHANSVLELQKTCMDNHKPIFWITCDV